MADLPKLLPCPFCGNELYIRRGVNPYGHCETVGCFGTRLQIVPFDDPLQVKEWNTRASRPTPVTTEGGGDET